MNSNSNYVQAMSNHMVKKVLKHSGSHERGVTFVYKYKCGD